MGWSIVVVVDALRTVLDSESKVVVEVWLIEEADEVLMEVEVEKGGDDGGGGGREEEVEEEEEEEEEEEDGVWVVDGDV